MVRIRLRRTGAKNNPAYRIVVADQKAPRDGAFIETLGHYLPTRQPHVVEINGERARHWLSQGAQPSDTARSLLRQKGIVDDQGKVTPEGTEPPVYAAPAAKTPAAAPVPVAETPIVAEIAPAPVAEAPVAEVAAEPDLPRAPEDGEPRRWSVATSGGLGLYDAPSADATKIDSLPDGAVLSNLGCTRGEDRIWCRVQPLLGGPRGFAAAEFLRGRGRRRAACPSSTPGTPLPL